MFNTNKTLYALCLQSASSAARDERGFDSYNTHIHVILSSCEVGGICFLHLCRNREQNDSPLYEKEDYYVLFSSRAHDFVSPETKSEDDMLRILIDS